MMEIQASIDIEDEIRKALSEYLQVYCRPLPEEFKMPCILIQQVGGTEDQGIDTFTVVLDSRAELEAQAKDLLNTAVGVLKKAAGEQTTALRHVTVNSSGSWGNDPVRPEIAMCSARLEVVAHKRKMEV